MARVSRGHLIDRKGATNPDAEICAVTQVDTLQAAVAIIPVLDNVSVGVFPLPTPLVCLGQSVHAFIGYGAALHKTDSL